MWGNTLNAVVDALPASQVALCRSVAEVGGSDDVGVMLALWLSGSIEDAALWFDDPVDAECGFCELAALVKCSVGAERLAFAQCGLLAVCRPLGVTEH